jgi:hypothetical protein
MTHELGPEARALLDAAREGLGPDAAAIRRMRAKIDASIASGAGGTGAGSGAGSGAGTAGAGSGGLAMTLGAVALVAALAAGAFVYLRRGAPASEPRGAAPAVAVETPAKAPERAPEVGGARAARASDAEPEIEMAPLPVVRAAPTKPSAPPPQPQQRQPQAQPVQPASPTPSAPAPRRADLAREVELVDRAMAALRRGAPGDALAAVRVHAAETAGAGQLAEDAAAIEIEALCRLHDASIAAKLAAFDARWPQSAQRSRLTTRCP